MKTIKRGIALVLGLVCILSFTLCSSAASKPIFDYVDIIPITYTPSGGYQYHRYLAESFEPTDSSGSITGVSNNLDGLANVVGVQVYTSWIYPDSLDAVVYVYNPSKGWHRSNYAREDVSDVYLSDCDGNLHVEIRYGGQVNTADIAVPFA